MRNLTCFNNQKGIEKKPTFDLRTKNKKLHNGTTINKYLSLSTNYNKNSYKYWQNYAMFNYKYYKFLFDKKIFLEDFLRVLYLIGAIFITLYSFALISNSFLNFIITLVVGNLALRVSFELILITLILCRNTTNISNKITNLEAHFIPAEEKKAEKKAKKEEPKEEAKEE
jgi:hypothetical protein